MTRPGRRAFKGKVEREKCKVEKVEKVEEVEGVERVEELKREQLQPLTFNL